MIPLAILHDHHVLFCITEEEPIEGSVCRAVSLCEGEWHKVDSFDRVCIYSLDYHTYPHRTLFLNSHALVHLATHQVKVCRHIY